MPLAILYSLTHMLVHGEVELTQPWKCETVLVHLRADWIVRVQTVANALMVGGFFPTPHLVRIKLLMSCGFMTDKNSTCAVGAALFDRCPDAAHSHLAAQ